MTHRARGPLTVACLAGLVLFTAACSGSGAAPRTNRRVRATATPPRRSSPSACATTTSRPARTPTATATPSRRI
ncbi:hypothetical protein NKH77_25205 [Streptomyces sp. M19]